MKRTKWNLLRKYYCETKHKQCPFLEVGSPFWEPPNYSGNNYHPFALKNVVWGKLKFRFVGFLSKRHFFKWNHTERKRNKRAPFWECRDPPSNLLPDTTSSRRIPVRISCKCEPWTDSSSRKLRGSGGRLTETPPLKKNRCEYQIGTNPTKGLEARPITWCFPDDGGFQWRHWDCRPPKAGRTRPKGWIRLGTPRRPSDWKSERYWPTNVALR